ncbi:MAG: alanine dehydrogenase, partial [Thermoanaerobaculia bacterium]
MRIGVPKEIKSDEYRVAMMPVGVELMRKAGNDVVIETQAGAGSGFSDEDYTARGATIVATHEEAIK